MEIATFGAGCFWGVEAKFRQVDGVTETAVGYLGGSKANPTYKDVCTDTTGHAEVVQVTFDPSRVSYDQLLDLFWTLHDPTTVNRQGPDVGTQYRSAIFFHSAEQERAAIASRQSSSLPAVSSGQLLLKLLLPLPFTGPRSTTSNTWKSAVWLSAIFPNLESRHLTFCDFCHIGASVM